MSEKERQSIITYIKKNDRTYSYNAVNFKYYSDADLLTLKKRLELEQIEEQKEKGPINSN